MREVLSGFLSVWTLIGLGRSRGRIGPLCGSFSAGVEFVVVTELSKEVGVDVVRINFGVGSDVDKSSAAVTAAIFSLTRKATG